MYVLKRLDFIWAKITIESFGGQWLIGRLF